MGGAISTGKEANVFHAEGQDKELAVKYIGLPAAPSRPWMPIL